MGFGNFKNASRKGSTEWTVGKLTTLILLVALVVLVIYGISSGGIYPLKDRVVGFWDNTLNTVYSLFGYSYYGGGSGGFTAQQIKDLQKEQDSIDSVEKNVVANHPAVQLVFDEGYDDSFLFRWNWVLNKVQVIVRINGKAPSPLEWLINPNIEKTGLFLKTSKIYDYEKIMVEEIVDSDLEQEMFQRLSAASKYDRVKVSISKAMAGDKLSFFESFDELSEKEIKEKLKTNWKDYYDDKEYWESMQQKYPLNEDEK